MRVKFASASVAVLLGVALPSHSGVASASDGLRLAASAACADTVTIGSTVGDLLSCALPEPEEGPAMGLRDGVSPDHFSPEPGVDYSPPHGTVPARPAFPAGCTSVVRGTWTQDQGVITSVNRVRDRTVFGYSFNNRYTSGFGDGGRGVLVGDIWIEPAGFAVAVGRELFEGTIDGRTGSFTTWAVGHGYATGRYAAHGYSTGGTEGLARLRLESDGVGVFGKGGHWTGGGRYCFAD